LGEHKYLNTPEHPIELMGFFNYFTKKKPLEESEDFEKQLTSITEFLQAVDRDVQDILPLLSKVKKLRGKERSEIDEGKQRKLLEEEIHAWDRFLERFVMFDRDVDVTGERVKKISAILKEEAHTIDTHYSVKRMTQEKDEWVFNW